MSTAPKLAPADPYALVERVAAVLPEGYTVECVGGRIIALPRPKNLHVRATTRLGNELGGFDHPKRPDDPGGWVILDEPELHLGTAHDIAVPDLAGWRRARLHDGEIPECAHGYACLAPDWVCEVLSPSTEVHDRGTKLPLYASVGVPHLWLLDPATQQLEVFRLDRGRYSLLATHRGDTTARAEPFDALPVELSALWAR